MNSSDPNLATDLCYRCGYDLRATPDDRPCPECGLLAQRSRRPSDELRHSRPKWLESLAIGAILTIASIVVGLAWLTTKLAIESFQWSPYPVPERLPYGRFEIVAAVLFGGVWLLSRREDYPPADRADRRLRLCLRIAALAPLLALTSAIAGERIRDYVFTTWPPPASYLQLLDDLLFPTALFIATVGTAPLPLLLFRRLRGLAKRARSAHLAEHCTIVGVGTCAALLYVVGLLALLEFAPELGLGDNWVGHSAAALMLMLILGVAALLFLIWGIYLFVRFTVSFTKAAADIRRA